MYTFLVTRRRSSADLHIRLAPKELRAWKAAARRESATLTAWMRAKLNLLAIVPNAAVSICDPIVGVKGAR